MVDNDTFIEKVFPIIYLVKNSNEKLKSHLKSLAYLNLINLSLYVGFFYKYGFSLDAIKYCGFASLLLAISFIDIKTKYIYRHTVMSLLGYLLVIGVIESFSVPTWIFQMIIGFGISYGFVYLIVKVTGGMGEGDADVAGLCGLGLGIVGGVLTLFIATISGAFVGSLLLLSKRFSYKSEMPFAPYLAFGAVVTMLFGQEILNWYYLLFS